jgi:mannose-6-phosphate isomerase-like protein (cupin superfamily)
MSEAKQPRRINLNLNDKFGKSTLIDIPAEVAACSDEWFNQTLTTVNSSAVRLGIVRGEFHWHKHDREDEFFLVLDGQLLLDIDDQGTVVLDRHQAYTVPKGVLHRTRAPQKTVILMIEPVGVVPTGD